MDWALERGVRTATSYPRPEREQIAVEQPSPLVMESAVVVDEPGDEQHTSGNPKPRCEYASSLRQSKIQKDNTDFMSGPRRVVTTIGYFGGGGRRLRDDQ